MRKKSDRIVQMDETKKCNDAKEITYLSGKKKRKNIIINMEKLTKISPDKKRTVVSKVETIPEPEEEEPEEITEPKLKKQKINKSTKSKPKSQPLLIEDIKKSSNPLSILELNPDVEYSQDELKIQYKYLAKKYHPDRGGTNQKFQEITTAYNELVKEPVSNEPIEINGKEYEYTPYTLSFNKGSDTINLLHIFSDSENDYWLYGADVAETITINTEVSILKLKKGSKYKGFKPAVVEGLKIYDNIVVIDEQEDIIEDFNIKKDKGLIKNFLTALFVYLMELNPKPYLKNKDKSVQFIQYLDSIDKLINRMIEFDYLDYDSEIRVLLDKAYELTNKENFSRYEKVKSKTLWYLDELKHLRKVNIAKKGKGIVDSFTNLMNKGTNFIEKTGEKIKDFGKAVIYGRNDYQPVGRAILKKFGNEHIKNIEIGRDPVIPALKSVLNLVSGGEFGKRVEKANYDDLFHLFLIVNLESGKKLMVEKNEVIIISETIPVRSDKAQYKQILTIPQGLTFKSLMDNGQKRMGSKYFTYSAKDNNCQDFLVNLMKASGIGGIEDIQFIKQDTKQLFKDLPLLRKFSNSITDFAGRLDVIISGQGLDKKFIIKNKIYNNNIYKMEGGKLKSKDVEKFFRNIGKKVVGKKATKEIEKFGNQAGDYITSKKGGLATDLIDYGVPAATAAILGGLGGLAGGPLAGVAGSAAGSKLGKEIIAKELHKATGAGMKSANPWIMFVKSYAQKNGMKYNEALKDPRLKLAYQKSKK